MIGNAFLRGRLQSNSVCGRRRCERAFSKRRGERAEVSERRHRAELAIATFGHYETKNATQPSNKSRKPQATQQRPYTPPRRRNANMPERNCAPPKKRLKFVHATRHSQARKDEKHLPGADEDESRVNMSVTMLCTADTSSRRV